MLEYSPDFLKIWNLWLSTLHKLARDFGYRFEDGHNPFELLIEDEYCVVRVNNPILAKQICLSRKILVSSGMGLRVFRGRCIVPIGDYPPFKGFNTVDISSVQGESRFAREYPNLVQFLAESGTVSIHSTDSDAGYPCLFVFPFRGIEARLCKPIKDLLLRPAANAPGLIGFSKISCIQQTLQKKLETRQNIFNPESGVKVTYEHFWEDYLWKKACRGIRLNEKEVLVVTQDLDDRQIQWWEERRKVN